MYDAHARLSRYTIRAARSPDPTKSGQSSRGERYGETVSSDPLQPGSPTPQDDQRHQYERTGLDGQQRKRADGAVSTWTSRVRDRRIPVRHGGSTAGDAVAAAARHRMWRARAHGGGKVPVWHEPLGLRGDHVTDLVAVRGRLPVGQDGDGVAVVIDVPGRVEHRVRCVGTVLTPALPDRRIAG